MCKGNGCEGCFLGGFLSVCVGGFQNFSRMRALYSFILERVNK